MPQHVPDKGDFREREAGTGLASPTGYRPAAAWTGRTAGLSQRDVRGLRGDMPLRGTVRLRPWPPWRAVPAYQEGLERWGEKRVYHKYGPDGPESPPGPEARNASRGERDGTPY